MTLSPNSSLLLVPRAFFQLVGRVLHEARHHVLARRRDRRIGQARDHHVDVGPARVAAVLGVVVGALHVIDAGRNRDRAAQVLAFSRHAGEVGQRVEREVHFARRAAEFVALHFLTEIVGQVLGVDHLQERQVGIDARRNDGRVVLVAAGRRYADRLAVFDQDLRNRYLGLDFDASFARRVGDGVGDRAGAAARETPGAKCAVDLAHVVVQQHVGGAGRAHAEKRADDSRRRHRGLEHVGLEPLVEEIDGAHGHELHLVVLVFAVEVFEAAAQEEQLHQVFGIQRRRVGRHHREDRLHEAAHLQHRLAEFVVGFGVELGVARNFAPRHAVIVDAPEVIAVGHRREGSVERQNFKAVTRQIELANDLGPQQRDHVGADGKLEAGKDFFGDRRRRRARDGARAPGLSSPLLPDRRR